MRQIREDKLELLFSKIHSDNPSDNFESGVMAKIHAREKRKNLRRQWLSMLLLSCMGIITMMAGVFFTIKYTGMEWHLDISKMLAAVTNPHYLLFGMVVIILLIADFLIRNHINTSENRT